MTPLRVEGANRAVEPSTMPAMTGTAVGGSILGAAVKRAEDPRLITGQGTYVGNLHLDRETWMVPVRSQVPHGVLTHVDREEAAIMPGVLGVFVGSDFDVRMPIDFAGQPDYTCAPLIAIDTVRFVGDIVAVVVAETERQAVDAAAAVWADIDPLPAIPDVASALAPDAVLIFPEHGSNIIDSGGLEVADALAGSEIVIRAKVVHQRVTAVPLETNNALASVDGDHLDVWLGTQAVHAARNVISSVLGLDRNLIRVRVGDMGGGFGAKIAVYREQVLCAALARRLQRPVRWSERRSESMVAMTHGRAQVHEIELGARRDGRLTGARIDVIQDVGGWPLFGTHLPKFTQRMAAGPYAIPKIEFNWRSVATTTTPVHAYRGAGRPEATVTLERAMDLLAAQLDIDPAEIRRRNFHQPEDFPLITSTGERYDSGEYEAALALALSKVDYSGLRRDQAERRGRGDRVQLGIGVASYVEITAPGGRKDWGSVAINQDGSATVASGALSHGHGHETTFPQLISDLLQIPHARISFVQGDTDLVVRGGGTMGSRSLQMAGSAVFRSGQSVLARAKQLVADALEASVDDIELSPEGTLGVAGVPDTAKTWAEVAHLAVQSEDGLLQADDTYVQEHPTVPFGTHVSVVEVDTETGDVTLLRHIACDDAGTILNRLVLDGQVHGGVAQGIGQALFEEFRYDGDANPLTTNLTGYLLPTAGVIPSIEVDHTVTSTPENPLGVKGIGEAGTVGSTPAVLNAVMDAIRHLGVDHLDMPLTPSRVWTAIQSA